MTMRRPMTEITEQPLEGRIVEVACQAHRDQTDCRGVLHRAVVNPYALELDGVEELIDVCDGALQSLYDGI
jgi:hypothetical protein